MALRIKKHKISGKKAISLTLDEVRHVSGTNPLLLSLLMKDPIKAVKQYESDVKSYVKSVMVQNLKGLGVRVESLEDFFEGRNATLQVGNIF